MNLSDLLSQNKVRHFTVLEITKGKHIPFEYVANIIPTVVYADFMRKTLNFPIAITSSFRTWEYHVSIYRSQGKQMNEIPKDSLHLVFNALDLVPVSGDIEHLTLMQRFAEIPFILYYEVEGREIEFDNSDLGVGYYQTFIHIDSRGTLKRPSPSSWGTPIF